MDRGVYDRMREIERDHWWFVARRAILADQIGRLHLPPNSRILEVGCGTGGNLAMLSAFGQLRAIEPDEDSRAYAARGGVSVDGGLLPDGLPDPGEGFDLIAAFDVIEHVDEDIASVAALARQLKPGGWFIATVPANAWMWSRHDEMHHHKRRYDLNGFRALFEAAGLTVAKASHFNTLLFPPIAAVRLTKALLGVKGGDDDTLPGPPLNALLRRIFSAETGLLRFFDLPFGVSILLVARRPA